MMRFVRFGRWLLYIPSAIVFTYVVWRGLTLVLISAGRGMGLPLDPWGSLALSTVPYLISGIVFVKVGVFVSPNGGRDTASRLAFILVLAALFVTFFSLGDVDLSKITALGSTIASVIAGVFLVREVAGPDQKNGTGLGQNGGGSNAPEPRVNKDLQTTEAKPFSNKIVGLSSEVFFGVLSASLYVGLASVGFGAWLQHLYTSFNNEQWGFLIAGAIAFPVAIVHGVGIWLGYWPG